MRILVAGSTGVIGSRLVPLLEAVGHEVTGLARSSGRAGAAALDKDVTGVLNVVDDTPVTMGEFLPAYAGLLDAPAPKRAPAALARLAGGSWGVAFMNGLRGADNTRARLRLDWRPRHPSWRAGMETGGAVRAA